MTRPTCVITGASRGIGLASALRFARGGYNIVTAARHEADLDAAVEQISAAGGECLAVTADVAVPEDAAQIISAAFERFGRVDVLVNNAGRAPLAPLEDLSPDEFDAVTAVNMAGVYHMTRAVWPIMKQRGGGVIVNISSLAAFDPFPGFAVYGASKAWVNLFTKALAVEGKPHNIRVFAVAPGAVETTLMRAAFPDFPTDKTLAPDAVAAVIESVCDERMRAASGETICVRK